MSKSQAEIERADADYWRQRARQDGTAAQGDREMARTHEAKATAEEAEPSKRRTASLGR